ncbi:hypothetical protein CYY_001046 [Polysphondylium violaceum]|uniref:IPT/TIG domain-containing protein n=1 Tax=Polysphondylium violaceum TaxID=133409 RepID=A0A8J4Q2I8_9MYCE|nr:hypothetical protein CYY_001046 [Polysphondylium violaceum]
MNYQYAKSYCESYTPPEGFSTGYLATITTLDEYNWVTTSQFGVLSDIWIAGSDLGNVGNWTFNVGPEKGQLMYDLYSGRSYTFTHFLLNEPSLIDGENYLYIEYENGMRNTLESTEKTFVCEFSPIDEVFIPAVHSDGGMVTVNVKGYDITTLEIKFIPLFGYPPNEFFCQDITKVGENTITCNIQSGVGQHVYIISDKDKHSIEAVWEYQPPYVSIIAPVFDSGSTITLAGDNFGNDPGRLQVTFDVIDSYIMCTNIQILTPSKKLSCTLSQSLTKVFPMEVSIDVISMTFYKTAFYDRDSNSVFSISFSQADNYQGMLDYSKKSKVDGDFGYLSVFATQDQYNLAKQFYSENLLVALGVTIDSIDPDGFKYSAGPAIDENALGFYYSFIEGTPDVSNGEIYCNFDLDSGSIHADTKQNIAIKGGLIQYGGYNPTARNYQTPFLIDSEGGTIFLELDNFGTSFSNTRVLLENKWSDYIDYFKGGISITIGAPYLGLSKYPINVAIDDDRSLLDDVNYDRTPPSIISIEPPLEASGGIITITGKSFTSHPDVITVQGIDCNAIQLTIEHRQITCSIGPGSGMKSISIIAAEKISNSFNYYYYQDPTITSIPPIPTSGGIVTIQGTGFGIDKNALSIDLCTNIEIITEDTTITCIFNQGQGDISVILTIGTYSTPPFNTRYQYPTISNIVQTNGDIDIIGDNFGWDQSKSIIKMDNDLVIGSSCTLVSNTYINCSNLATVYGPFSISNDNGVNFGTTYKYDLKPYITSTFDDECVKPQEKLTIQGGYMVSKSSTFKIKIGEQYFQVNNLDSSKSELIVPDGSGVVSLQFEIDNTRLSNPISISYCPVWPPVIKSVDYNRRTKKYEITGTGFSTAADTNTAFITSTNGVILYSLQIGEFTNSLIEVELPIDAQSGMVIVKTSELQSKKVWLDITPEIKSATSPLEQGSLITITGKYFKTIDVDGNPVKIEFSSNGNILTCQADNEVYVCPMPPGSGSVTIQVKSKSIVDDSDISEFTTTYTKESNNNNSNSKSEGSSDSDNSSNTQSSNSHNHSSNSYTNSQSKEDTENSNSNNPTNTTPTNTGKNSWRWKGPLIGISCLLAIVLSAGVIVFLRGRASSNLFNRFDRKEEGDIELM